MHKLVMLAAVAAAGVGFAAETVTVTTGLSPYVRLGYDPSVAAADRVTTNGVVIATAKQNAVYPTSVGEPLFWLDCSDRTGWGIDANGTSVTNIPSKAGSKLAGVRFLTSKKDDGDWGGGWGANGYTAPVLMDGPAEIGGGKYLEFGTSGSPKALRFNAAYIDEADTVKTNALYNVGTTIFVRGADETHSGGWWLGACPSRTIGFHRSSSAVFSDVNAKAWFNPIFNSHAQDAAKLSTLTKGGHPCSGYSAVGYQPGFEVMSLQSTEATIRTGGIGCDDARSGMNWVCGGQMIAEAIFYDRVLTREEIVQVEMYLEQKWFGSNRPGWNGEAEIGDIEAYRADTQSTLDVPSGEAVRLGRYDGGNVSKSTGVASFTKNGEGTLVIDGEGFRNYCADFILNAGTVRFPAFRSIPTAAELPDHLYGHFDASDAAAFETDSETVGGKELVARWNNEAEGARITAFGKPFHLEPRKRAKAPWMVRDALGDGMDVVNFGPCINDGDVDSVQLFFTTNGVTKTDNSWAAGLECIQTVVALIGCQEGGGALFDNVAFDRNSAGSRYHTDPLYAKKVSTTPEIWGRDLNYWSNGRRWEASRGYETRGYQVAAFQTHGGSISRMGINNGHNYGGGLRVGEVLFWNRQLTDDEIRDAQAYLSAKWLKKATPGYQPVDGEFAADDIQYLTVPAGKTVTIDVGAGRTARIGKLTANGRILKTGAGRLEVREIAGTFDGTPFVTQGGSVGVIGVRDVANASEMARGASIHLDASKAGAVYHRDGNVISIEPADRDAKVTLWSPSRWDSLSNQPLLKSGENGCNGLPVIDFGNWGSGRWLHFSRPLHSMKSVYAVIRYSGSNMSWNGFLFGDSPKWNGDSKVWMADNINPFSDESSIAFHPNWEGGYFFRGYADQTIFTGENSFTNGVAFSPTSTVMARDEYLLLELHPTKPFPASQIALDRYVTDRSGGFAIGELLVYERELSDREKVATRNYLNAKWFNKAAEALPEAPAKGALAEYEITVDGAVAREYVDDVAVGRLTGAGTFTKTGAGTATISDVSALDGTLAIEGGKVVLKGEDITGTAELVTDGIVYHADATYGLTTVTNDDGRIRVTRWDSKTANGYYAVATHNSSDQWAAHKFMYDPDLGYRPVVDMNAYGACFEWKDSNGDPLNIDTIRSVFWMIGSQNGGGFILGGGTNGVGELYYGWHRDIYYLGPGNTNPMVGTTNICHITNGNMQNAARTAEYHLNGELINAGSTGLSGGWDQLSMVVQEGKKATATGFAYDGRSRKAANRSNVEYNGHQRLAEVIVYDRRVTDEERVKIENYLDAKWNRGKHAPAADLTVAIASDAVLELEGASAFEGLSGTGTVKGDVSAASITVDLGASGALAVDGAFTLPAGFTVTLEGELANHEDLTVMTVGSFVGGENLGSVVFNGAPLNMTPRLRYKNGELIVQFRPKGTLLIFR